MIYPATADDHSESSPFPSIHENGEGYLLTSKKICDYMDLYLPDKERRKDPYAAPLNAPDLSSQPRTLVITAEFDPLRDEGEAMGRRLDEAGVEVTTVRFNGVVHDWGMLNGFAALHPTRTLIRLVGSVLRDYLEK